MNSDLSHVLAFFAASAGFVLANLAATLLNDVEIPEVRCCAYLAHPGLAISPRTFSVNTAFV